MVGALLTEWLLLIPEDMGSNPVVLQFLPIVQFFCKFMPGGLLHEFFLHNLSGNFRLYQRIRKASWNRPILLNPL